MIQKISHEDVTVIVDTTNKANGVEVHAVNESYGVVMEIRDRVKRFIKDKPYSLSLSETNHIQDIIMNVVTSIRLQYKPESIGKGVTPTKMPPVGLRPKYILMSQRMKEITNAIERYINADHIVPTEWIEEYNECVDYLRKEHRL